MNPSDVIGWIGSICFAICGIPQAWQCIKQGHAKGISPLFLALWFAGEVCYILGVYIQFGFVLWMMVNYLFNVALVSIMIYYSLCPRNYHS
jgi:uncharacterized protein with PQ loop repeat